MKHGIVHHWPSTAGECWSWDSLKNHLTQAKPAFLTGTSQYVWFRGGVAHLVWVLFLPQHANSREKLIYGVKRFLLHNSTICPPFSLLLEPFNDKKVPCFPHWHHHWRVELSLYCHLQTNVKSMFSIDRTATKGSTNCFRTRFTWLVLPLWWLQLSWWEEHATNINLL